MNLPSFKPETTLYICRDIPFNISEDVLLWASRGSQQDYFESKVKYYRNDYTPISDNAIHVDIPLDDLKDCSYIFYKNANYNDKIFYCYITELKWQSVSSCIIIYELDPFQTYIPNIDYTLSGFVEREHVSNDAIGANTLPENLEQGEYFISYTKDLTDSQLMYIVMATSIKIGGSPVEPSIVDGMYSGVYYYSFENTQAGADLMTALINLFVEDNKQDAILCIMLLPSQFVGSRDKNFYAPRPTSLNGYTPVNNKLFTYPYTCLTVATGDGNYGTFRFEFSDDTSQINFKRVAALSPNPKEVLFPLDYKGASMAFDEKLTLGGYPFCPYTTDQYKAWLAMNGATTTIGVVGQAMNTIGNGVVSALGVSAMTANPIAGGVTAGINLASGIMDISKTMAQVNAIKELPPQIHGSQGGNINFQTIYTLGTFKATGKTIKAEYARCIDDYFSRFGYKVNRVKTPNINSRTNFNYLKMIDCRITGRIPQLVMNKICSRVNAGVRFWHSVSNYNNYSLTNGVQENE